MFIKQDSQQVEIKDKSLLKLLFLAAAGFLSLLSEAIPAGMLFDIGSDLGITTAMAGQFITLYAAGCFFSAIPLSFATRNMQRRTLLSFILAGSALFNLLTALLSDYHLILIVRFLSGMTGGLLWATLSGYARSMVSREKKGRAVTIAYAGIPLALALGIPVGVFISELIGWRSVFYAISALTVIMTIFTPKIMPAVSMPQKNNSSLLSRITVLLANPSVRAVLIINFTWAMAHNMLYIYVLPILENIGLGTQASILLMNFGISSVFGVFITGLFIDRNLTRMVIIFLALFLLASLIILVSKSSIFIVSIAVMAWGTAYGGASAVLPAACAEASEQDVDLAQSLLSTTYNLSFTIAGITGGLALSELNAAGLSLMIFFMALMSFSFAALFKHRGLLAPVSRID